MWDNNKVLTFLSLKFQEERRNSGLKKIFEEIMAYQILWKIQQFTKLSHPKKDKPMDKLKEIHADTS